MQIGQLIESLKKHAFLQLALLVLGITLLVSLIVFAYIGTFTRFGADDYCFSRTLNQSNNLFKATITWYLNSSNRFTTILLIGISEWFGPKALQYLPALAISFWIPGLSWTLTRVTKRFRFPLPGLVGFTLAVMICFFAILETPNRYQSVYWRSAMMTYFIPLVALSYLIGWLLNEIWRDVPRGRFNWIVTLILVGLAFFLTGGLSETTLAIQGGALGLAILAVFLFTGGDLKHRTLTILSVALLTSTAALLVMLAAPANALRIEHFGPPPSLPSVLTRSLLFGWDFIRESFEALPTPHLVSLMMGLLLGYSLELSNPRLSQKSTLTTILAAIPVLCYLLSVFAMAPSVYGQNSYAGERSLIASQTILVSSVSFFGLFLGIGMRQISKTYFPPPAVNLLVSITVILLAVSAYYPLYTSRQVLEPLRWYRYRAEQWDLRDAYIRQAVANGETDLIVRQLDTIGGVQEYKVDNWVNRCAAEYYGLDSLTAIETYNDD
ncbi:MAG: hypothetical protein JXA13_01315 [Anaerolineales bacterium]|nr:hypothetical protein [Anaerolineales bacterium]